MQTINDYVKREFGQKLYKLAISGDFTCPNRDGTCGVGGCIFCSQDGSGDFAERGMSVTEQIEKAKLRVQKKTDTTKFIAYFQRFTSTYAPIEYLQKIFYEAINHKDIAVLSIATRPDCLPDEVLNLLYELNKIKPVWVELGFQTANETTAQLINRGYTNDVFDKAVYDLKQIGVKVIVHTIIGLPNETKADAVATTDYVCARGIDGIKFQLLHVLKNTALAKMYENGEYTPLEKDEYIDILMACIERTPESVVIHRMTGDGPKKILLAPNWSANKRDVLNSITKELKNRSLI